MEDLKELDFSKLETIEQIEAYVQEKMGANFSEMKATLSANLKDKAEELTLEFTNIAPYAEYDKMLEDNDSMAVFLKEEATKEENWLLNQLEVVKHANQDMLEIVFTNKAVDDGDTLEGYIFLSKSGKIRHAFTQGNGKG
jgi:hypothetical protein